MGNMRRLKDDNFIKFYENRAINNNYSVIFYKFLRQISAIREELKTFMIYFECGRKVCGRGDWYTTCSLTVGPKRQKKKKKPLQKY